MECNYNNNWVKSSPFQKKKKGKKKKYTLKQSLTPVLSFLFVGLLFAGKKFNFNFVIQAQAKIVGSLQKSSEIMKLVNSLVRLPEIQKNMMELQSEMMKAGILDEMMEDALDGLNEEDGLEEEAEGEVEKVLFELTDGKLQEFLSLSISLFLSLALLLIPPTNFFRTPGTSGSSWSHLGSQSK